MQSTATRRTVLDMCKKPGSSSTRSTAPDPIGPFDPSDTTGDFFRSIKPELHFVNATLNHPATMHRLLGRNQRQRDLLAGVPFPRSRDPNTERPFEPIKFYVEKTNLNTTITLPSLDENRRRAPGTPSLPQQLWGMGLDSRGKLGTVYLSSADSPSDLAAWVCNTDSPEEGTTISTYSSPDNNAFSVKVVQSIVTSEEDRFPTLRPNTSFKSWTEESGPGSSGDRLINVFCEQTHVGKKTSDREPTHITALPPPAPLARGTVAWHPDLRAR